MCIKFLADFLKISSSQVTIVQGLTGRNKIIKIEGMDEETFLNKIRL